MKWCRYTFTAHIGTNGEYEFEVVVHATSFSSAKAQALDAAHEAVKDTEEDVSYLTIMRVEVIPNEPATYPVSF